MFSVTDAVSESTIRSKTPTQELNDLAINADDRARTPSRPATNANDNMRGSDGRRADYGGYGDYHGNRGYYDDYGGPPPHDPRYDGGYPAPHGYEPNTRRNLNHYDQYGRPSDPPYGGRTDLIAGEPKHREVRSRTPGPEFMRGNIADEDRYLQSRTRELRSKTPTAELTSSSYHHSSNLSGTPDFIPASRYANPPSSSSNHNTSDGYDRGRHPSDMVPYRHHNSTASHQQRPLSGPDFSSGYSPPTSSGGSGSSRLNSSQTYSGSLSYAAQQRNYDNNVSQQGYGYPDRSGGYPRKQSTSFENEEPIPSNLTRVPRGGGDPWGSDSPGSSLNRSRSPTRFGEDSYSEMTVHLKRQENGFGFRIIGGTEEGSQVSEITQKISLALNLHRS